MKKFYLPTLFNAKSTQQFINSLSEDYNKETNITFEYEDVIYSLYKDMNSSSKNPNLVLKLKNKNVLLKYTPNFKNITIVDLNTLNSAIFESDPDNNQLKLIEFSGKIHTKNEDILIQEKQDNISIDYKNISFDFNPKTKEKSIKLLDGIFIKKDPSENSIIIAENIDKNIN